MDELVVGIDLGTTYSAVAYVNERGQAEILPDEEGRRVTPSVVALDGPTPVVGEEAKARQSAGVGEVAAFFKRDMGNPAFALPAQGRTYSTIDLAALVLTRMRAIAEARLGRAVRHAVITVPAYFTHTQREATIEAGRQAGLTVESIISEPTAAALAYGIRPGLTDQTVLVYDLGGGTFDVSLVTISPTDLTVIATDGDHRLGGKDWDDRLVLWLSEHFQDEFGAELIGAEFNEIVTRAERAKRSLSSLTRVDITLHAQGHTGQYAITRDEFAALCQDLLERTGLLARNVLSDAGRRWVDITGIVPVGGSTHMPMVREYIERLAGKPLMSGVNPDEAVALGAAIAATLKPAQDGAAARPLIGGARRVRDVIAHGLGMIAESDDRSRYLNSILIAKNLAIPAANSRPYTLARRRSGATKLEVFLTQGETANPQECAYLGVYVFSDFPATAANQSVVDITYAYDANGVVAITALDRDSGQPLALRVEPVPADVPARFAGRPSDQVGAGRDHITVLLSFDVSGSMSGAPMAEAKRAALAFLRECDLSMTAIGILACADTTTVNLAPSQDASQIERAIELLRVGNGGGNSTDPFETIQATLGDVTGLRFAIVLADGRWGNQPRAIERARRCHSENIQIVSIGFGSADREFLRAIASTEQGSILTSQQGLSDAFSTIAREITETGGARLRAS